MNSIAVINCPADVKEISLFKGVDRIIPSWLKKIILKAVPISIKQNYFELLDLYINEVRFPIIHSELAVSKPSKIQKACQRIEKAIRKKGIKKVIFNKRVVTCKDIKDYFNTQKELAVFLGEKLNMILIEEVISDICEKLGKQIQNTSVTLIIDELNDWFESIIKNLCTKVRFLSIISLKSENFIPLADEIYKENGLIIPLGKKAGGFVKDSDFIAIFSNNPKLVNSCRYPKKAVMISFGASINKKNQNGIIIQGIGFSYKEPMINQLEWVKIPAFIEAAAENEVHDASENDEYEELKRQYLSIMKKTGGEISGYEGCRGVISPHEFTDFCKKLQT